MKDRVMMIRGAGRRGEEGGRIETRWWEMGKVVRSGSDSTCSHLWPQCSTLQMGAGETAIHQPSPRFTYNRRTSGFLPDTPKQISNKSRIVYEMV